MLSQVNVTFFDQENYLGYDAEDIVDLGAYDVRATVSLDASGLHKRWLSSHTPTVATLFKRSFTLAAP